MGYHAEKSKTYRHIKRWYVYDFLTKNPCVDCGESNHVVLEFDHVRGEKVKSISVMISSTYSLESLKREIEKCEVRCANCHRKATAERGGFYSFLLLPPPVLPPKVVKVPLCGTKRAYNTGCRCVDCKNANKLHSQKFRKMKASNN